MTNVSAGDGSDADFDLAESLYRVLATLTVIRRDGLPLSPDLLRERLELVSWLRRELGAAEHLLRTEYRNARAAPYDR